MDGTNAMDSSKAWPLAACAANLATCVLLLGWLLLAGCAGDEPTPTPRPSGGQASSSGERLFEQLKGEEQRRAHDSESAPTFKAFPGTRVVQGEVLVKFKDQLLEGEALPERVVHLTQEGKRLYEQFQVGVLSTFPLFGIQRLKCPEGETVESVVAKLNNDPDVELAEPNYKVYAFDEPSIPNDPRWGDLWGMEKIKVTNAWSRSTGSGRVVIGVIDTGIDYTHPDLAENMWKNPGESWNGEDDDGNGIVDDVHGANFCDGANSGNPLDDNGHGTHVAGTIAAIGNNNRDVVGVNWKTQLMAVKFLCKDGSGTTADAIQSIHYALSKGADILNNSWGGSGYSRALEAAVKEANRRGALFVAAAGNETNDNDRNPSYPASYTVPNVLAVAATAPNDELARFSNWGRTSVHLAAPGVSILSTIPGNKLDSFSGTSMAAPHAAGCAGLIKARDPSLSGAALKAVLVNSADKIPRLDGWTLDGRRLNCGNAVP